LCGVGREGVGACCGGGELEHFAAGEGWFGH
jgi:hypothetical protein